MSLTAADASEMIDSFGVGVTMATIERTLEGSFPCTLCSCSEFLEGNPISTRCNRRSCAHDASDHGMYEAPEEKPERSSES